MSMISTEGQSLQYAEDDRQRGIALLVSGAVMVLLKWLVPIVAPLAIAAYAVHQLYYRRTAEGLIALAVAVVLWFLRGTLGALFWFIGAVMAGVGIFLLIRGMRA